MSGGNASLASSIASRLVRHAAKVLPPTQENWADAMAAELAQIAEGREALQWALGCVFASYLERVSVMTNLGPHMSRPVLCIEMACVFALPTAGFFTLLVPPYYAPWQGTLFLLSMASLGPIGLGVAFKTLVLNRPALPALAVWALRILTAWAPLAFILHTLAQGGSRDLDWWRGYLLVALLPALAAAHLSYLNRPQTR